MATKKSNIDIKPSKRGSLRKAMGAKKGQKLSVSAMRSRLKNASPAMQKKLQFAINARKWRHEDGGLLSNLTPDMFSGVADIGSSLIDTFANPDYIGLGDDRYTNINEGAKAGSGALKGAAAGAAAGSIVPGIGTLIGGGIGAIGGALSGWFGGKNEEKLANEQLHKNRFSRNVGNRLSSLEQSQTYLPVAKQGGFTVYNGEAHDGPTGGILTDEYGNPSNVSQGKPIALTENKEVAWYNPNIQNDEGDNSGSTYIFSSSLGFARPVTRLVNQHKLDKDTWNNPYKNDALIKASVDKQMDNFRQAQEFAKETKSSVKKSLSMLKSGGLLPKYQTAGELPQEEPWPSYLDVRKSNKATEKEAAMLLRTMQFQKPEIVTPTPGLFPGIPYEFSTKETPLEIAAGNPIVRNSKVNQPDSKGSGIKRHGLEPLLLNTQPFAYDVNIPKLASSPTAKLAKISPQTNILDTTSEEQSYSPQLNPLGHVLSGIGSLADYAAMRKAKPTDVSLPRVGAERISLARQRLMNERGASAARATNVANTRKLGMNAGATFSNLAGANTGVNRLLGEQNMQSLLAEETTNAQMEQQANTMNAQIGSEEAIMNNQQQNTYKAAMARMNPAGNLARTAASYFADDAAYKQGYDTLQMLAPNAELYGSNNTWLDRFKRPKVRLRDKTV